MQYEVRTYIHIKEFKKELNNPNLELYDWKVSPELEIDEYGVGDTTTRIIAIFKVCNDG